MAAAEAMAAGLPLVISEKVGLARHVARLGVGRVTSLDADEIAGHLADLLADCGALPGMGRRAQGTVAELFGLEPVGRQLVDMYRQVLAAGQREHLDRGNPPPHLTGGEPEEG